MDGIAGADTAEAGGVGEEDPDEDEEGEDGEYD